MESTLSKCRPCRIEWRVPFGEALVSPELLLWRRPQHREGERRFRQDADRSRWPAVPLSRGPATGQTNVSWLCETQRRRGRLRLRCVATRWAVSNPLAQRSLRSQPGFTFKPYERPSHLLYFFPNSSYPPTCNFVIVLATAWLHNLSQSVFWWFTGVQYPYWDTCIVSVIHGGHMFVNLLNSTRPMTI